MVLSIKPNILAERDDYTEQQVVGSRVMKDNRGKVVVVPSLENNRTGKIIEKVQVENADQS
jgi:bifunctional ADP-heptose synthase (sugar kinase/adenylyltransferase)